MSSLTAHAGSAGHGGLTQLLLRAVWYVDFYAGVGALVALSITVMLGVLAMDRFVLQPRHRLQAQLMHRAVATSAVFFLIIHAGIRVLEHHLRPVDLAVPFLASGRTFFVGLGVVSAWLMVLLLMTGMARSRFAHRTRPTTWRAIHALAYVAWPAALLHGLQAGREPKSWVSVSYVFCVVLVLLGLAIRALTGRRMRPAGRRQGRVAHDVRVPVPRRPRGARPDMFVARRQLGHPVPPRGGDPLARRRR